MLSPIYIIVLVKRATMLYKQLYLNLKNIKHHSNYVNISRNIHDNEQRKIAFCKIKGSNFPLLY